LTKLDLREGVVSWCTVRIKNSRVHAYFIQSRVVQSTVANLEPSPPCLAERPIRLEARSGDRRIGLGVTLTEG
jgi:hypothetical protein